MSYCFKLSLLSFGIALTGCGALPQSIEMTEDRSEVVSSEIAVTVQETPSFMFVTPTSAMTASWFLLDAFIDTPTWQEVIEFNKIPDFTQDLRDKFIDTASKQAKYDFVVVNKTEPMVDSEDFSRLTEAYSSPYILEFRTRTGVFGHGVLSWQTMHMSYFGDATLVRRSDGQAVWRATCGVKHSDSDLLKLPTQDIFDGTGEEFRAAADYATLACSQQLAQAFLK